MKKLFMTLGLLIGLINGCRSQTSAGQINIDKLLTIKLDSVFSELKENEPGGSFFIQKSNQILYSKSFGLADIKKQKKFTEKTVSNIGSISKTFVAYGILILQKQGKLSIEDNILKYFPDFKNKEIANKVKIKHLLTHTSGLPDSRNVDKDSVFYLTAKDEENFAPLKQTDTLEFESGSDWNYCNPAFDGLALIIEKVSGMKWQTFIHQNIFIPAGMKNSKITDGPFPENNVAHGYKKVNNQFEEFDYGEYPTMAAAGNGGVWSSIEELRRYVEAMKICSFLDCENIKFSQKAWTPANWKSENPAMQGFTWFVHEVKDQEKDYLIEHSGSQAGFRAHILMYPEPNILIIWLSNNDVYYTPSILDQLFQLGLLNERSIGN